MALLESLAAMAVAGGIYGFGIEPRRLMTRTHRVPWPRLFSGGSLRIAVLSDIHAAWPHMTVARIGRVVERVLALEPQLVLLAGDYVTTDTWGVRTIAPEPVARALAPLAARCPTFAVLGNHDWDLDGKRVRRALEAASIRVLSNEAVKLQVAGAELWLGGLEDPVTLRHDLDALYTALPPDSPAILLSHTPDVFNFLPDHVRLVIAGHTHGGQVCVPGFGPLVTMSRLPRQQAYGLHRSGERHLFVTGGLGTTGIPVRFARPPEIGVLDLVPAEVGPRMTGALETVD